jgi:hypothetical protein
MNNDILDEKPDISGLGFNESQFNNNFEDSQYKDVIEESVFAKPSLIGNFLQIDNEGETELAKRFRKSNFQENFVVRKSDKNKEPQKKLNNEMFDQPQNFPDLDTSGIEIDDDKHIIDNEFGAGSFIGGIKEHNSFEAEDNNNMFDPKPSPFVPNENNIPITPQVGFGSVSWRVVIIRVKRNFYSQVKH